MSSPILNGKAGRLLALTAGIGIFLGLIPISIYAVLLGSVPQVHSAEALRLLSNPGAAPVLLDVRPLSAYKARHINGAVSLPLPQILEADSIEDLPAPLQGKTLLLVCDMGLASARAARHLVKKGIEAISVRGGMQDWGRAWPENQDLPYSRFELEGGVIQEPYREITQEEQAAAALALLWVKPTYMLLSAGVSAVLLRRKDLDLRILGWGLLVFLVGEIACAINYLLLRDNSYLAEYIHSYSMAAAFGLAAFALIEGLDRRLLHFSQADRQCAFLAVCGPCIKYRPVRCGVRRIAQLACISLILLGLIPLVSPFSYTAYSTQIGPFNHYYVRPVVQQWFEARYSPLAAIALISMALVVMQITPKVTLHPMARALFCAGSGFLGFAMFRVALGLIFAGVLGWATVWEEFTELMFTGSVIYVLWVFRSTLLPEFSFPKGVGKALS